MIIVIGKRTRMLEAAAQNCPLQLSYRISLAGNVNFVTQASEC
jgi:hypothetical protein